MGAVYLALQCSTVRRVALKVLSAELAQKQNCVCRFQREVEIQSGLQHPNIVQFLGAGQEKGVPFLVMEYIDGISTAALVRLRGRLHVGDALFLVRQVADAMNYAFATKVVHRDIKPENILITRLGQTKIADLGLAKSLDAPHDDTDLDLTGSGTSLGSPKYMAPEQSYDAKLADHRSDIFGLGGVLYFLLTAAAPFKGTSAMELLNAKKHRLCTPARRLNEEVPARLDLIIDKMLAKEPKYRYQHWTELIRDLDSLGLCNEQLSFDLKTILGADPIQPPHELVEILLIDSDEERVRLARQGFEDNRIASELVVVGDGADARAFLRREGKHLLAAQPNLIIFGPDLDPADSLLTLAEIRISAVLSSIPLVLLAHGPATSQYFAAHGYRVNWIVNLPGDVRQFNDLFTSIRNLSLTVMEL